MALRCCSAGLPAASWARPWVAVIERMTFSGPPTGANGSAGGAGIPHLQRRQREQMAGADPRHTTRFSGRKDLSVGAVLEYFLLRSERKQFCP